MVGRASSSTGVLLACRRRSTGRCTNGTPRPAHSSAWSGWLATTTRRSHGSSPDDHRTSRSARQCGWRDARIAVGSGWSVKRTSARMPKRSAIGANAGAISSRCERRSRRARTRRAGRTPASSVVDVEVLVGVEDVAVVLDDEVGDGGDEPALVGARQQQHRRRWAWPARSSGPRCSPTEDVAGNRRRGGGVQRVDAGGQRDAHPAVARGQRRPASGRPAPTPTTTAQRGRWVDVVDVVEPPASGVSAVRRDAAPAELGDGRRRRRRRGRGGGRTPCPSPPAATRRASGSALRAVEHEPVPAEGGGVADDGADVGRVVDGLDDDEPVGRRRQTSATARRRALEQRPRSAARTPRPVTAPAHVRRRRRRHVDAEPAPATGGTRSAIDERGDRPAAGVERPLDDEVALGEEQPGAGVVALVGAVGEPRSLSRNGASRGSAGSSTGSIDSRPRSVVVRERRTSPAGASRGRRRGPRPPRRCRRPGGWPRRRTAAGRRGRRRSG